MMVIGIFLLLWQFVFFGIVTFVVWVLPSRSAGTGDGAANFLASNKFVYEKFKANMWFFIWLILVRNLALSFLPVVGTDEPNIQIAICDTLILIGICFQCYSWPWNIPLKNAMDSMSLVCCMLVAIFAVPWLPATMNPGIYTAITQFLLFFVIVGGLLAAVLSATLGLPAFMRQQSNSVSGRFHHLGPNPVPSQIASSLQKSATWVGILPPEDVAVMVSALDVYDQRRMDSVAQFLAIEFQDPAAQAADQKRIHVVKHATSRHSFAHEEEAFQASVLQRRGSFPSGESGAPKASEEEKECSV